MNAIIETNDTHNIINIIYRNNDDELVTSYLARYITQIKVELPNVTITKINENQYRIDNQITITHISELQEEN